MHGIKSLGQRPLALSELRLRSEIGAKPIKLLDKYQIVRVDAFYGLADKNT